MEIEVNEDYLLSLAWGEKRNAFAVPLGTRKSCFRGTELPSKFGTDYFILPVLPVQGPCYLQGLK